MGVYNFFFIKKKAVFLTKEAPMDFKSHPHRSDVYKQDIVLIFRLCRICSFLCPLQIVTSIGSFFRKP